MEGHTIPIPKLPDGLIIEILTWLPVKPLLKFRCVCKSWRTLISSQQFVADHLKKSKSDRNFIRRRLIMESRGKFKQCLASSVLCKPVSKAFNVSCPFQTGEVRFVGSCNGLICVSIDGKDLILWNPSTRIWKKLPGLGLIPEVRNHVNYGFGFDKSSDDYKLVVRFYGNPDLTGGIMQVYSLRNDEWKVTKNFLNDRWMMDNATFVEGKVYWTARGFYGPERLLFIVSFDLEKEEGAILQLPSYLRSLRFATLGAFKEGSLLVSFSNRTSEDVWIMDGCSVGDEKWTKVATMPYTNGMGILSYKRALHMRNGRVLFLFTLGRKYGFVRFDAKDCSITYPELRTKSSRLQRFLTNDWFQLATYLETLVSPF